MTRRTTPRRAVGAPARELRPLDLGVLSTFFGVGPAWADPVAGRYRFRVDAAAGGWLELFVAPGERLVSLRTADGAVTSMHVDMTLDAVETIDLRTGDAGERWLEIVAAEAPAAASLRVSITLRPDILVVLAYGRR